MPEFVKCLWCSEPVFVDFQSFVKIKCSTCLLEIPKKLLTWCKCSHAGVDHVDATPDLCRFCDCTNFIHVQDRITDEYDEKLR